ncbi:MAG: hypothetical protein AAFU80_04225 [Pseudomonadota bacterium]
MLRHTAPLAAPLAPFLLKPAGTPAHRSRVARLGLAAALCAVLGAGQAPAQTLTERDARAAVPDARGVTVSVADVAFLGATEKRAVEQYAKQFDYYAAMAVSPGDPADTGSAVALANYHSPQDAQQAALAACNARRTTGGACVIVATVVPRDYAQGPLTLSKAGVDALKGPFRQLSSPKAFAISPSTGHFGFARGDGGRALSACGARASADGASDCRIVIFDQ